MNWLIAEYKATTLFSLKMSNATSSAAKSLLCPTPYAIKMALLDAIIHTQGVGEGEYRFAALRDMRIAVGVPERAIVSNCFIKVLDPVREKGKKSDQGGEDDETEDEGLSTGPLKSNITFREYVFLDGSLLLAFAVEGDLAWLVNGLAQINSFGKRGCFFQLQNIPEIVDQLPSGFVLLSGSDGVAASFPLNGLAQVVDDMVPRATFNNINTYSTERGARESHVVVLPYKRRASSKGFTYYVRINEVANGT